MTAPKLRILFVAADTGGCAYARCHLPALGLNRLGGFEAKAVPRLAWDDLLHHDVIVWARQHQNDLARYREFARGMGKVLVFEIDDYLHGIPMWNPASRDYPKGGSALLGLEAWMKSCDALTVSTRPLAEAYGAFNADVVVLPNSVDPGVWRPRPNLGPAVRIGWVGSITHRRDLQLLKPVLKAIRRRHHNVQFVMMGYDGDLRRQGIDLEYHPFVRIEEYPDALAELSLDIAMAPLDSHSFNLCKSNIKYLEYGALGIPCVASRFGPYLSIRSGETGFLACSTEEWIETLSMLIDEAPLRRRIGAAAREHVLAEHDIHKTARLWAGFYDRLASAKPGRKTAVAGGPLLAQMHMLRAVEAIKHSNVREAIDHMTRAREADSRNATVRLLLAEAFAASGMEAAAREEALASIELAPAEAAIRERASRILQESLAGARAGAARRSPREPLTGEG